MARDFHTRRSLVAGGLAASIGAGKALAQTPRGASRAPLDRALGDLRPNSDQDQSPVLQRALALAAPERRPVHLPPGRFRVGNVGLPPGVALIGAGEGATILVQAGAQPLLAVRGGDRIAVRDLTIEGSPAANRNTPLLSFSDVARLDVAGLALAKARGIALRLERCGGRIEHNTVAEADIAVFSLDATGLRIVGNTIDRCNNNGIQVWRSQKGYDGTQVLGNRVANVRAEAGGSGQNGNGVNVFRAGGVIVANNVVRECAFSAVRNNAGDDVQIVGNSCTNLGEVAIYAEFSFEGCVIANNLVDRANVGVSITNFNENGRLAVASGNIVRNLFRRLNPEKGALDGGTGIAAEADTAVTGNVVEGAEFAGIALGYGTYLRDVVCADNVVRRCAYGVIASVVAGSGAAHIANNVFAECSRGRIVGFEYDKPASGDLMDGGERRFAHLIVQGNSGR
jgi:uncharacterized secreted repeat protein (TIGR03808 family)